MPALRVFHRLTSVIDEPAIQYVEVRFLGVPPVREVERASGVSKVEVSGPNMRCIVYGSFQPFLEALRGHEVLRLTSTLTGPSDHHHRLDQEEAP